MADFIFPDTWFRERKSETNDLGFTTILGSASGVSPWWDYLRARQQQDPSDDSGRRGIAPNVEPPPGSPEFRAADAELAAAQAATSPPNAATAAATVGALGDTGLAGARLVPLVPRLAPLAAVASAAALAVPLIAVPKIAPQDETLPLGSDFRARRPIGQRSIIFERRIADGLLGTGIGAKWEELPPIDAAFAAGLPGLRPLLVEADQLRRVIGDEMTDRLLATGRVLDGTANRALVPNGRNELPPPPPISLPSKIEMRIGVSTGQGATTVSREATREEVQQVCPNFPEYERYAMDAAAKYKALGYPNGWRYGQLVHKSVAKELLGDIQSRLEEKGLVELAPELALHNGIDGSYDKGSSRLDVVELHKDHITVCVYEIKTGRATIPMEVMLRYVREARMYADATGLGYQHVYFIPIRVP